MQLDWKLACHAPHFIPQSEFSNPKPRPGGGMVYATDLKSVICKDVWVRVPPRAPFLL